MEAESAGWSGAPRRWGGVLCGSAGGVGVMLQKKSIGTLFGDGGLFTERGTRRCAGAPNFL